MKSGLPKILIMCGGRGRRLGKVGEGLPKPLLKVNGKTILKRKLENYIQQGFDRFVLCTGYKGEMIQKSAKRFNRNARIEFSDAGENVGILKRIHHARDLFSSEVIMTYGDTYADLNLKKLLNVHHKSKNEVTIVVAPIESPFGLVEFDHEYKVTFFKEKPILNYYMGYAVISHTALDYVSSKVIDLPDGEGLITFYKILMGMEKLGAFYYSGLQVTFNTQDELKQAERRLKFYTAMEEK